MAYGTLLSAKEELQIAEVTWDTEITNLIPFADAYVDNLLKYAGFSVPLSSTPKSVEKASNLFIAWMFRLRRDPAGSKAFFNEANDVLQKYIDAEKNQPYLGRV
jgi:hypothetical protein